MAFSADLASFWRHFGGRCRGKGSFS